LVIKKRTNRKGKNKILIRVNVSGPVPKWGETEPTGKKLGAGSVSAGGWGGELMGQETVPNRSLGKQNTPKGDGRETKKKRRRKLAG